jgi:hypothetical protein
MATKPVTLGDYQAARATTPSIREGGGVGEFLYNQKQQQNATAPTSPVQSTSPMSAVKPVAPVPSLTLDSRQFVDSPVLPQSKQTGVPSFEDALKMVQDQFNPLGFAEEDRIKQAVAAEFAPRYEEQRRVNEYRDSLFNAMLAQRGDAGFGQSDLGAGGKVLTQQQGANKINELRGLQAAEEYARIQAATDTDFKRKESYLNLANQLRDQQLQELQNQFTRGIQLKQEDRLERSATATRAQSTLENLTELDADQLSNLGDLSALETSLSLPAGYIDALRQTKLAASQAATKEDFAGFFNEATKLALTTPSGQSFSLTDPTSGNQYQFIGSENDMQVVSSDGGIWMVDKNTQEVKQLKAPTPKSSGGGTDGGVPAKMSEEFKAYFYTQTGKSVVEDPTLAQNAWADWYNSGQEIREKEKGKAEQEAQKVSANDVWQALADPGTSQLSDEEKAYQIQQMGFDPRDFGFDLPY